MKEVDTNTNGSIRDLAEDWPVGNLSRISEPVYGVQVGYQWRMTTPQRCDRMMSDKPLERMNKDLKLQHPEFWARMDAVSRRCRMLPRWEIGERENVGTGEPLCSCGVPIEEHVRAEGWRPTGGQIIGDRGRGHELICCSKCLRWLPRCVCGESGATADRSPGFSDASRETRATHARNTRAREPDNESLPAGYRERLDDYPRITRRVADMQESLLQWTRKS